MTQICLDGKDYTTSAIGINQNEGGQTVDFEMTFQLSEDKAVVYNLSSSVTFIDGAFQYIAQKLFSDKSKRFNSILAQVKSDCCDETFDFEINRDTVSEFCPEECRVVTNLKELTEETRCKEQLASLAFWEHGDFLNDIKTAPDAYVDLEYCEKLDIAQTVLLALYSIPPLSLVIVAADLIFPNANVGNWVTGCPERFHPSPRLGYIFDYAARSCGLRFKSSILNDPANELYYCSYLVMAQNTRGLKEDNLGCLIADNLPGLSVTQLSELIKPLHNADYRIKNGELCYERKDHFKNAAECIGNAEELYRRERTEDAPCYRYKQDEGCQSSVFEYCRDTTDIAGNEQLNNYNDRVNNDPLYSGRLKGECRVSPQLSPVETMRSNTRESFGERYVDARREGGLLGDMNEDLMILKDGISAKLKVVSIDKETSKIVRKSRAAGSILDYVNYPYWYAKDLNCPELYKNFHEIDHPFSGNPECVGMSDFTFQPDNFCKTVRLIRECGTQICLNTRYGRMYPSSVSINLNKGTVVLSGLCG